MNLYQIPFDTIDDNTFEDLTRDALNHAWDTQSLNRFGRRGQKQDGIDIIGNDHFGFNCVIQCKHQKSLTVKDINDEIIKLESISGEINTEILYFATTAPRDVEIQKFIITESHKRRSLNKFALHIIYKDNLLKNLISANLISFYFPFIKIESDSSNSLNYNFYLSIFNAYTVTEYINAAEYSLLRDENIKSELNNLLILPTRVFELLKNNNLIYTSIFEHLIKLNNLTNNTKVNAYLLRIRLDNLSKYEIFPDQNWLFNVCKYLGEENGRSSSIFREKHRSKISSYITEINHRNIEQISSSINEEVGKDFSLASHRLIRKFFLLQ